MHALIWYESNFELTKQQQQQQEEEEEEGN